MAHETPETRNMPLEGTEALDIYVSGIFRNMVALKAAMGSLEAAVAERKELLIGADPLPAQNRATLPNAE